MRAVGPHHACAAAARRNASELDARSAIPNDASACLGSETLKAIDRCGLTVASIAGSCVCFENNIHLQTDAIIDLQRCWGLAVGKVNLVNFNGI
jgi:hypothetical protein